MKTQEMPAKTPARRPFSSCWSSGPAAGLLFACLTLALAGLPAAPVQAQDATLVSNFDSRSTTSGITVGESGGNTFVSGQQFTTGAHSNGYLLKSLRFRINTTESGTSPKVSIYTSVSDQPGSELYTFANPSSGSGNKTVNAQNNAILAPNTSYFVVFEDANTASGDWTVARSTSFTEYDTDSLTDWSLAGRISSSNGGTSWGSFSTTQKIAIKLVGEEFVATTSGKPNITGTRQVGMELTATKGTIADTDGLPDTFPDDYSFQWVRVDSMDDSETDISGATAQTYTPVAADVGNTLKVEVSFTDDGGTDETIASDATATVVREPEDCANRSHNDWCATMTAGIQSGHQINTGYGAEVYGDLDMPSISYGSRSFSVRHLETITVLTNKVLFGISDASEHLPRGTVFNFGGTEFTANGSSESSFAFGWYRWDIPTGFGWIEGQRVTVSANLAPWIESAALEGTSLVLTYGENLDTNSVPAASAFEVDVDGSDGPAVTGVSVSGNTVTLTLARGLTGSDTNVTVDYTAPGSNPLQDVSGLDAPALNGFDVDISAARGKPNITGTPQVGMELTAKKGTIADPDGLPGTFPDDYSFQWVRVGASETETDIGSDSHTYMPVAADVGNSIKVEVSFTDGANNPEGPLASNATATVVREPEDCANRSHNDWCATMTAGLEIGSQINTGYGAEVYGDLDMPSISYGSRSFPVAHLETVTVLTEKVFFGISGASEYLPRGTVFNFGGTAFTANGSSENPFAYGWYRWDIPTGFGWIEGQKVTVSANLAPWIESAAVDGTSLVLTYGENLDTNSVPAASAYTVEVDGTAVTVSGVSVSGNKVTLTLATAVASTATDVTVDYEVPTSNPLQDVSGLDAPALSGQKVGNSADATLASLAVEDGGGNAVSLDPAFDSATMSYTAEVANTVTEIAMTAATTDDDASVTGVTLNGTAIVDTNFKDGIAVPSLIVGDNAVVLTVTAENTTTTEDYTVTVTRASPPVQALVSNIGQHNGANALGFLNFDSAQGFTTGSASATLDSIDIKLKNTSDLGQAASRVTAKLFKDNLTGTLVATLTSTDTLTADSTGNYTFTAPANTTLDASTTYHVLFESSFGNIEAARTNQDAEDSGGADGWSIANGHRWRTASSTGSFSSASEALMIRVNGTEATTASDDATLDSLAVVDGDDNAVSLDPAFDSAEMTYTANVANTVTEIAMTAATTDDGASVTGVTLNGTAIADTNFTDGIAVPSLIVGDNTIVVKVTAEDTTSTEDYTVTVTRAAPPPAGCETDDIWCANLTVAELRFGGQLFGYGYIGSTSQGTLSDDDFKYGSPEIDYTVSTIRDNGGSEVLIGFDPSGETVFDESKFVLYFDGTAFNFGDATFTGGQFEWASNQVLSAGDTVLVRLVEIPPNTDATGAPSITGAPQVGGTLTAGVGTMADANDLPTTTFPDGYSFQWVSVDSSSNETDISGATAQTYEPVAADVGNTLKVEVSFTDGDNYPETLASDPVGPVVAALGACAANSEWSAVLTMGYATATTSTNRTHDFGFTAGGSFGSLVPSTISHGSTDYTVTRIYRALNTSLDGNTINAHSLQIAVSGGELPDDTVLNFGGTELTVGTASDTATDGQEQWNLLTLGLNPTWVGSQEMRVCANLPPGIQSATVDGTSLVLTYHENLDTSSVPAASAFEVDVGGVDGPAVSSVAVAGNTVTLTLATAVASTATDVTVDYEVPASNPLQDVSGLDAPALDGQDVNNDNTAATGKPNIPGVRQVGQELTARKGNIADADGLPDSFPDDYTFQWVRVDDMNAETDITGATAQTYTLVAADVGHSIKVKVSFIDDGNSAETRESNTKGPVLAAPGPCPAGNDWCSTMTAGAQTFGQTRSFGYDSSIGQLDDPTIDYGPSFEVQTIEVEEALNADGNDGVNIFLDGDVPDGSVFNLGGTEFAVQEGSGFMEINDGLYQWDRPSDFIWINGQDVTVSANLAPLLVSARVDGTSLVLTYAEDLDTAFTPATDTYRVNVAGVVVNPTGVSVGTRAVTLTLATAVTSGQTVRMRYDGTVLRDLSGLAAPTFVNQAVVNNNAATGKPSITGVAQVGGTLTAGAGDMADADNLPVTAFPAGYTFQWVSVDSVDAETDIAAATQQTYSPAAADVGKRLRVEVTFTDGGDSVETLASDLAGPVAAAAQDCADRTGNDWCATMTAGVNTTTGGTYYGYDSSIGQLDDATIHYGPSFEVRRIGIFEPSIGDETVTVELDAFVPRGSVFDLGGTTFTADSNSETTGTTYYTWDRPASLAWINGQEVTVSANLAPLLESAALSGTSLTLTYAEALDTNSVPAASAYTVKVDGAAGPAVSSVAVSGNTVTLTLATALTGSDMDVTLDYTAPASNPLQDVSGLDAPALDGFAVDISAARGQPAITGTPQVGMQLTAGQGDIADPDGLPGAFPVGYTFQWVRVGTNTETDIGSNSQTYTPVAADVGNSIRVEVSFTDGANNPEGPLASDPTATVVAAAGACAAGSDWCATMTVEEVDTGGIQNIYGYWGAESYGELDDTVIDYGPSFTVQRIMASGVAGSQDALRIVLDRLVPIGSVFDLGGTTFTVTGSTFTYDWSSAGLAWIDGQEVTVSANLVPLLTRAVVEGTTLTLTYAEDLDTGSVPAASAYSVTVDGTAAAPTSVAVSGDTVTLTLATAVISTQTVALDYTAPSSNPLQDESGLDALSFSNQAVATDPRGALLTPPALEVNEGATLPYTVALTEAPTGPVTVTVGVSGAGVTLSTSSLVFTTTDWRTAKRVEVTAGEDDNVVDEEVTLSHTPSGGGYDGVTLPDLVVTVADNDGGIEVDRSALTVAEGGNDSYSLTLTRRPTSDVTVTVTGYAGEVTVEPSSLTFTSEDWSVGKPVEVTGAQDADKNDESVTLRHTATGGGYSVEADDDALAAPVKVTVEDDEATAPGAPDLEATGANESVRLEWSPPNDDGGAPVTGYRYRRDGGTAVDVPGGADARSVTVPGLANGTEYSFELRALNRVGEGDWSTAQTAEPSPLTLTVEAVSEEVTEGEPVRYRIVMSECTDWVNVNLAYRYEGEFMRSEPSSSGPDIRCEGGALEWEVERGTVDDDAKETHGSFTVTLRPGDGYRLGTPSSVTVRILDNDGGTAPGQPPGLAVSVVSPTMLDATWRAAPDNGAPLTGYALEYREGTAGPWTRWPEAIKPDTRSVRIGELTPGTAHQVRVRAKNVRGDGPWSAAAGAQTAPDPGVRVSIARPDKSRKNRIEGDTLVFTVSATPAPSSALRVDVRVTETLESILGRAPGSVTVPAGQDSASFEVRTEDDNVDEGRSEVTAELLPSVRYVLEGSRAATYTVGDNDDDTDRGRPLNPAVEAIEDPRIAPHVQEAAESPIVALRLTWEAPSDIPLEHVRGWLVEWSNVASCAEPVPTADSWPGGGNYELEDREFLHRPRNAAHLRVAAILVGDGIGQWSEPVCGDKGDFVPEPDEGPGPEVTSVAVAPDPNRNGRWTPGEELTITVEFSDTVTVRTAAGTPSIRMYTDAGARDAVYSRGSGTAALTFVYTMSDTDKTSLSVVVAPNSLDLNGGAIVGPAGRAAVLDHEKAERSGTPPPIVRSVQDSDTDTDTDTDTDPPEKDEPPSVSVADAKVREGPGAQLAFAVSLSWAAKDPVTVGYRSDDRSATAGQDYRAVSGTLTFKPGETSKRVRVEVLDDVHDEGEETMLLALISAAGAQLADSVAVGTIENSDPMPAAWIARLGRAASDNVIEAVSGRWQRAGPASAAPQTHFTFGGRRMDGLWTGGGETPGAQVSPPDAGMLTGESAIEGAWAQMDRMHGEAPAGGKLAAGGLSGGEFSSDGPAMPSIEGVAPSGGGMSFVDGLNMAAGAAGDARWAQWLRHGNTLLNGSRAGLRELLMNSSFHYSPYSGDGDRSTGWLGDWAVWGQSAATRFSGAEQALGLNGEVATALVGFDSRRGRWLAGMALSYTEADGGYSHPSLGGGTLSSVLTGLHPYAHFELSERTQLWGLLGYGGGDLLLKPQADAAGIETGLAHSMAALGGRTALGVAVRDLGRFELAVRADARFTETSSEAVAGLSGASGATSRLRALLEGRGTLSLAGGAVLTPTIEAGLRYDAGDAETGAGLEMGAGLGYAMGRILVQVNARGLLAHEDAAYEEWGYSASVTYRAEANGRGLSLKLGSVRGQAQSGLQSLWNQPDAANLAGAAGAAGAMAGAESLSTQIGYGFDGPFGGALWRPFLAMDSADAERRLRAGLEIASGDNASMSLEIGRREMLTEPKPPELALQLQGSLKW